MLNPEHALKGLEVALGAGGQGAQVAGMLLHFTVKKWARK